MNKTDLFGNVSAPVTLLDLTAAIGNALRINPNLQGIWVTAELSDVRGSGGHCYMELIEKNDSGQTVAKLRATIWANVFREIRSKFYTVTGKEIATGMKVMVKGSASHHPVYGLSFSINDIDPSYTLGDMERLRREILARLQREGIIDNNRRLEMPLAPQRIAVISAEGAAGYGDFMHQLTENVDGLVFYPYLIPAVMQGDKTSATVRGALEFIEQTIDLWDCVAIVRGGGATTDLNGFDDYELAKAVATFPLPIVVGIGHERDRTVLDEIANIRMKTPTAVASYFIDRLRESYSRIGTLVESVVRYGMDRLTGEGRRLSNCEAMLPALAESRLASARAFLDKEMTRIPVVVTSRLTQAKGVLDTTRRVLGVLAGKRLEQAAQKLDETKGMLSLSLESVLRKEILKVDNLAGMIDVLNPMNTLRRGYSVTRVGGKAVTDVSEIKPGQTITTKLYNGEIESTVKG